MENVLAYIFELEKLKGVTRKIKPLGLDRYENSAEHSWQLAMLAVAIAPLAAEPVDLDRVIPMLLVHDVGEIDTGDTIAFATEGLAERKEGERQAIRRIFGLLEEPQRSRFLGLWEEFEEGRTPEARLAHAADRAMPVLLNLASGGQSWRENAISYERLVNRVREPIANGCPALWEHLAVRLEEERARGWFGIEPGANGEQ
jgi:putative hydrolase of HD superfamily